MLKMVDLCGLSEDTNQKAPLLQKKDIDMMVRNLTRSHN